MDSSPSTRAKTFKYNSPHPPIFNIIEGPFHHKSFSQDYTIRDASFSSYVKPKESDKFPSQVVNCVADETELNVFDAQKYFSESNNDPKENQGVYSSQSNLSHVPEPSDDAGWRLSSASSTVDGYNRNFRVRSFHATPTASSEASWNSQTGLLSNPPGSIPVSLRNIPAHHGGQKRGSSSAAKWIFCRKCPCSGEKSVQVDEGRSEHKTQSANEDNHNDTKANFHQKRQGHRTHEHEKMVEKISIMSQKSSASDHIHDHFAERHQQVSSNTSRFSSENHFMSSSVLQRVSASGRAAFSDGTVAFSFPILNPSYPIKPEQKVFPTPAKCNSPSDEPPRVSLEIFQPSSDRTISRKSMDKQRVALANTHGGPLDHRGNFTFPGSPVTGEDDVASDASSDLFEIESFSTQTTSYPMYRRRDSLDDASTFNARRLTSASNGLGGGFYGGGRRSLDEPMTPTTENYAPSEASIDWSVTTAEGFDRASITNFSITASEIEDFASNRRTSLEKGTRDQAWNSLIGMAGGGGGGDNSGETGKKKGNGLLLSCRHERAVSVGPHPVKCMPEGGPPLPLVSTSGHVNTAASRPPKPNTSPLANGHSARLSLAFAA